MKKRVLSLLLVFAMIVWMVPLGNISVKAANAGDSEDNPILIHSYNQLNDLRNELSNCQDFSGKYLKLADDFPTDDGSLTEPIGNDFFPFNGNFDGNCKTVKLNITYDMASSPYEEFGMFGYVSSGTIKNVLTSGSIGITRWDENDYSIAIGSVAGRANSSKIINCGSTTEISVTNCDSVIGGIVGSLGNSYLVNCYARGSIWSSASAFQGNPDPAYSTTAGGIVGYSDTGYVYNCYATGNVSAIAGSNANYAGGISGSGNQSNADNLYALDGITVSGNTGRGNNYTKLAGEQMKAADGVPGAMVDTLNGNVSSTYANLYGAQEWIIDANKNDGYPTFVPPACYIDLDKDGVYDVGSEKKYFSVAKALKKAETGSNIHLIADIDEGNIDFNGLEINIDLNDCSLKGELKNADNVKFLIGSETDMKNAIRIAPAKLHQTWEIKNDITLKEFVRITDRYLVINGNNHTVKGELGVLGTDDHSKAMTNQMFAIDSVNTDSRNNITINNLKIIGSERFKNVIAVQNKDDNNNGIKLNLTNVVIDHSACRNDNDDGGAAILNIGSVIKVNGKFSIVTGENSCYAIGMDLNKKNASLSFEEDAIVTFTDNRNENQKLARALIFISNRDKGNSAIVEGKYVDKKLEKVMTDEIPAVVCGYNIKAVKCKYQIPITESTNAQMLYLGKEEAGEYIISGSSSKGFTIKDENDKYIALDNGVLNTDSDSSYTWKYDGGLYVEIKTTTKNRLLFWTYTTTKTTKNYLSFNAGKYVLSNSKVEAKVLIETTEHELLYKDNGDAHIEYCKNCGVEIENVGHSYNLETGYCVCGKYNPTLAKVTDVKVTEKKTTSYSGWLFWAKKTTKYQYTISTATENVKVSKTEYSLDGQTNWNRGSSFSNSNQISEFYIRITDSNGKESYWKYKDGEVTYSEN